LKPSVTALVVAAVDVVCGCGALSSAASVMMIRGRNNVVPFHEHGEVAV
jgi:hypothetical protein